MPKNRCHSCESRNPKKNGFPIGCGMTKTALGCHFDRKIEARIEKSKKIDVSTALDMTVLQKIGAHSRNLCQTIQQSQKTSL